MYGLHQSKPLLIQSLYMYNAKASYLLSKD